MIDNAIVLSVTQSVQPLLQFAGVLLTVVLTVVALGLILGKLK